VEAVRASHSSLSDRLGDVHQAMVAQARVRPETLLSVPLRFVRPEFFAAEELRGDNNAQTTEASSAGALSSLQNSTPSSFLALSLASAASAASASASASSSATSANVSAVRGDSPRPTDCPEGCPVDPVVASMRSVEDVWREWFVGLDRVGDGGRRPSLLELDRRFGAKWRYSTQLRTRYFNRKKLVEYIRKKASEMQKELEEVVEILDGLGHSPDKLVRLLKAGNDPIGI
jgi:hypothetical protein